MRTVTIILLSCFLLGGCNTFKGLGEDLRQLGSAIERSASRNN